MILTTICYLEVDHKMLLLYRNKKKNDINEGKWIGIGGKIEQGETPLECIKREFKEETNLEIISPTLKAYVLFPGLHNGIDEGMFLYKATAYKGELTAICDEGQLAWVDVDKISTLPMWQGDKYLFDFLKSKTFIEAKLIYDKDQLKSVEVIKLA